MIPLDEVRTTYFSHLSMPRFAQKLRAGDIELPICHLDGTLTSAKSVHLMDLAIYIDARRAEALRDMEARRAAMGLPVVPKAGDTENARRDPLGPRPYSSETLATEWGCTAQHIRDLVRQGELPHFRVGRLIRIPFKAATEFWESGGVVKNKTPGGPRFC